MSKTGIALVVFGIILVAGIWGATSFVKQISQVPETFTVGKQFIEELSNNNLEAASKLAVSDLQSDGSLASLAVVVEQNADILNANTEVHFTGRGIDNDIRYAYGRINSGELELPIYMEFEDENGETRVTYFSFNQEDIDKQSTTTGQK